jgi:hypothetical protein
MMRDLKPGRYLVWDELNCDDEDADECGRVVIAEDAELAAVEYAETDSDGWTDGLYQDGPQPLKVRDHEGRVSRFEIGAELVPQFRVTKRESPL